MLYDTVNLSTIKQSSILPALKYVDKRQILHCNINRTYVKILIVHKKAKIMASMANTAVDKSVGFTGNIHSCRHWVVRDALKSMLIL